jgi:hypothetical protein
MPLFDFIFIKYIKQSKGHSPESKYMFLADLMRYLKFHVQIALLHSSFIKIHLLRSFFLQKLTADTLPENRYSIHHTFEGDQPYPKNQTCNQRRTAIESFLPAATAGEFQIN